MKIVRNTCYGGFGLSPKAIKRMAELQGRQCFFFTHEGFGKNKKWVPTNENCKDIFGAFAFDTNVGIDDNDNKWWDEHYLDSRPKDRTDPLLIQVVEELGRQADGPCALLEVVEIPDGTQWEISEYDGVETIDEQHQSW